MTLVGWMYRPACIVSPGAYGLPINSTAYRRLHSRAVVAHEKYGLQPPKKNVDIFFRPYQNFAPIGNLGASARKCHFTFSAAFHCPIFHFNFFSLSRKHFLADYFCRNNTNTQQTNPQRTSTDARRY
jgi:hypothetical protein